MKTVELIERRGNIAIIKFQDMHGMLQCGIIDGHLATGETFEVADKVIKTATPYGIDWDIVYPNGLVISAGDIQETLYGVGIYTLDDLRRNTNGVIAAITSILKLNSAKLINHARVTLEAGGK